MAISPRRGEFVLKSHLTAELICVLSKDEKVPANSLRRNTLVYDWDEQLLALEGCFFLFFASFYLVVDVCK